MPCGSVTVRFMSSRLSSRCVRIVLAGAATAVLAGCGAPPEEYGVSASGIQVCPAGTTVEGIDVSSWQGNAVDWGMVRASGREFGIARISDGTGTLDTTFTRNWTNLRAAGMVRGAYQFFRPAQDPIAQADIVVNAVGTLGDGDLPVTIDVEVTGGQTAATIAANIRTWMLRVEAGTGKRPMVYTGPSFWNTNVNSTAFGDNALWIANWGTNCPNVPTGWTDWVFHQYSDGTTPPEPSVPSLGTSVDRDRFNGTAAQLVDFANSVGAPWGGRFVASSFFGPGMPPFQIVAGTTQAVWIEMRNIGYNPWDGMTRLGLTVPRSRTSPFAGADWVAADRPATVTGTVSPAGVYRFNFNLHAPTGVGTYTEHWGMVEDGVVWFSAAGQAGPADDQLVATIEVVSPPPPDAGTGTDASADGLVGPDATMRSDASVSADGGETGATGDGSATVGDARGEARAPGGNAPGCACRAVARGAGRGSWSVALGTLVGMSVRRRARRR